MRGPSIQVGAGSGRGWGCEPVLSGDEAEPVGGEELPGQIARQLVVGAGLAGVGADGLPAGREVGGDVDLGGDLVVGRAELGERDLGVATANVAHVVGPADHRRAGKAPQVGGRRPVPRAERKLYDEPKRLAAAGLASAKGEMTGARPRTIYVVTPAGRQALQRWLDEPPAPPALEFEGMVKVFFADAGTLEQLQTTLRTIAGDADARLVELDAKAAENACGDVAFPDRLHLNSIGLRFHIDHERTIGQWARWALEQTAQWASATDPGAWDYRQVFPELNPAEEPAADPP